MNDPGKFKAPFISKERIWQETEKLRAAHPAGRGVPVQVLELAEFDLGLELIPAEGLREELEIDALLMGDLKISQNELDPEVRQVLSSIEWNEPF